MILIYVIKCRTGKKYRNIVAADNCFTVGLKMACNGLGLAKVAIFSTDVSAEH